MLDGEAQIIKSAVAGEASAFGLLYDHYQPKIYRFVYIKVGRREEAEDLTHQVFLSAWENIENYKHLGFPFSSWLYQIARNEVIDYYRTRKSAVELEKVDAESFDPPTAELALERKFELEHIKRAIQKLKPEHQDVLIMRFVEDLSPKEIAAALGKTEGAVKLLQHRALKNLKTLLA
jgi:RNA polymerase sigma-70 factor (ECF subfamily)